MSELHQTTHWRRLREIINEITHIEGISLENYNVNKITCYKTLGTELQGENAEFFTNGYRSCWVSDNHYDMYEIPKLRSSGLEGEFYFIVHNTDFDYWMFGKMIYRIDKQKTRQKREVVDRVQFKPIGMYNIVSNGKSFSVKKTKSGKSCDYGFSRPKGKFDEVGARKRAYKTSSSKILATINGVNHDSKNIKGGDIVKIYKKKPKNNTKRKY